MEYGGRVIIKNGYEHIFKNMFITYLEVDEVYEDIPCLIDGDVRNRNTHRMKLRGILGSSEIIFQTEDNNKQNDFILWCLN
jgi:hypothetical protein